VIGVGDDEAIAMARRLAREGGMLAGFWAGANVAAAPRVAARLSPFQAVVTLVLDHGLRHLSTDQYETQDIPRRRGV
jgi:cysteine synthase